MIVKFPELITSESFLEFLKQFDEDQPELKRMVKRLEGTLWEYDHRGKLEYLRFGWRAYCSPKQSRCLIYFTPVFNPADTHQSLSTTAIRLHKFDGILRAVKSITFKDDNTMLIEYTDGNRRITSVKRGRR